MFVQSNQSVEVLKLKRTKSILVMIALASSLLLLSSTAGLPSLNATLSSYGVVSNRIVPSHTYIVTVSGSNYQILNGATRSVIYQSTSSSTTWNHLLGSSGIASDGDTVYVESGAYTVDKVWTISKNNIAVDFAPNFGAVLKAINNLDGSDGYGRGRIMWLIGNGIVISGVEIDGNGVNQSPSSTTYISGENYNMGIWVEGDDCLIQYSKIHDVRAYGVITAWGSYTDSLGVMNSIIYDIGANGLTANHNSRNTYFINNEVYNCGDVGIDVWEEESPTVGTDAVFTGNLVHNSGSAPTYGFNNAGIGISVENAKGSGSGKYIFIAGNTLRDNAPGGGISVSGWENGPVVSYVLVAGNSANDGILLNGVSDCIVEYNTVTNSIIRIGNQFGVPSDNNWVYGNIGTVNTSGSTNTHTTQPSVSAISVTSSPTGVNYVTADGSAGYAGDRSTSPYILYVTVGTSIALAANNVPGHTFQSWNEGGAQSHHITIPASYQTYTATYSP